MLTVFDHVNASKLTRDREASEYGGGGGASTDWSILVGLFLTFFLFDFLLID